MKKLLVVSVLLLFLSSSFSLKNTDEFKFRIEWAKLNKSLWSQPYRYENKELKSLTVKFIIERTANLKELNPNFLSLADENKKIRTRPNAVYYLKGSDKKIYLKSKPVNANYNAFEEHQLKGYQNFQAKTFKPNILGLKKKGKLASVKSLKKLLIKDKTTYYIDFPVNADFSYAKIYYKDQPIGFAAVSN